jgi:hypothetical protein
MKSNQKILRLFLLVSVLFISHNLLSQANEGFTYQAVIRNSSNALVANSMVGVRISLLQNTASGPVLYSERHTPTTNDNGLATFIISNGTVLSGSFSAIDWSANVIFLKTDTDPTGGTNYTITNTSQFKSVPFANYANEAGNSWKPTGNIVGSNEFIGSTNDADVVFKRNNAKAGKIGATNTYFGVGAGEFNTMGGNVAIGTNALNKGGGSGSVGNLNTAVGYDAYPNNVQGYGNAAFGNNSLFNNTHGYYNTAIGNFSLKDLTTGNYNAALGSNSLSGLTTGTGNIGLGNNSSVPSPTTDNQLSIGNVIYGANMGDMALGTIGIGVLVPTEKLEVAGKTKTTNLQVTNGAGTNKVLLSDAIGNANWTAPKTIPGTIYSTNHLNTSVRTTMPTAASTWEFVIGTPTQVTLTANQRVVISYNLTLGNTLTNTSNTEIRIGAGYRIAGSSSAINSNGNDYVIINPMFTAGVYNSFSFSSSFKPGVAGTYEIGAIIRSVTANFFNLLGNSWYSGYYMIVNE